MRLTLVLALTAGCAVFPLGVQAPPTTPLHFVNGFTVPLCAVNLWRPSQPAAEAEANWLELAELTELAPTERVSVGIKLKDGPYRLRAIACSGAVVLDGELRSLSADQELRLAPRTLEPPGATPTL